MSNNTITYNNVLPLDIAWSTVSQCSYGYPLVYSRLNSIPDNQLARLVVLGIIGGIGVILYLIALVLFIIRIKKQPLRDRSPLLLMISAIGGSVALAYMYFRQFFDIVLVCPISYYVMEISLVIFFVPYLFRCFRTIMLWNYNEAKASMIGAGVDFKEDPNPEELPRTARNNSVTTSNTTSEVPTPTSPISLETSGTTPIITQDVNVKRRAAPKKSGVNLEKHAKLIKYRRFFSEKFLLLIFFILLAVWIIGGIIVQTASSTANFWNPYCQKICNEQEGYALRAFIVLVAVLEIPYLILVILMRNINDEFSIRNELLVIIIFLSLMMIGMIVLVIVPGVFWPQQSYIGYLLGIALIGTFIISVVYPLINTWVKGGIFNAIASLAKKKQEDIEAPESSGKTSGVEDEKKGPSINQIEFFLTVNEGKESFKQFLVREFSVENLMFYTEVQYYKKIEEESDLKETAKTIHETYVELGAPFEINIEMEIRNQVAEQLNSGKPTVNIFDEAEKAVLHVMREESFPRFKKSRLYQQFVSSYTSAT